MARSLPLSDLPINPHDERSRVVRLLSRVDVARPGERCSATNSDSRSSSRPSAGRAAGRGRTSAAGAVGAPIIAADGPTQSRRRTTRGRSRPMARSRSSSASAIRGRSSGTSFWIAPRVSAMSGVDRRPTPAAQTPHSNRVQNGSKLLQFATDSRIVGSSDGQENARRISAAPRGPRARAPVR
jgi:hypothetical protein